MADEATLDTLAANQQTIITALGALTTIGTKLDTLNTSVGKVETAVGALKTELTAQMNATNKNMSYLGSGTAVDTGVDNNRVFVVSPWPPETETEGENEETNDSTD